jgi:hypothetical protein
MEAGFESAEYIRVEWLRISLCWRHVLRNTRELPDSAMAWEILNQIFKKGVSLSSSLISFIHSSALHPPQLQLLRWVLAVCSVWKKNRWSLGVVDISSICRVSELRSSSVTYADLFRSVVPKSCVWEPVRLKTGRGVV